MRKFDYTKEPEKFLTPEIVQMIASIHEHKGKQELFIEANIDELKTLLEVALIQSTGASNRIEGIFTSDRRLEELVSQKVEPESIRARNFRLSRSAFDKFTKVMNISFQSLILFCNYIGICILIPKVLLAVVIRILIM